MPDEFRYSILATDIVIFRIREGNLQVRLVRVEKDPFKGYRAVPGGLVNPTESIEAAAGRYLEEVIGETPAHIEQLYTFGSIDRHPRGRIVSVSHFSLIRGTEDTRADSDWFSVDQLPKLAYDHDEVVMMAIDRLRSKVAYSNIIYGLLSEEFTLGQLQQTYEIVLGKKLDKRNFRKKILSLDLVEKTDKTTIGKAHRPASLYRFQQLKPVNIQIL